MNKTSWANLISTHRKKCESILPISKDIRYAGCFNEYGRTISGKIKPGVISDAIFATIDFMPTFSNICKFDLPESVHIDGIDQTALLLGKRDKGRDFFYFNKAGVRKGKWKYLKADAHFYGYAIEDDREKMEELYNLEIDIGETNNLAKKFPEKVAELKELMLKIEKVN